MNLTHGIFTDNMLIETKKILATMEIPRSIFKYILTIEQVGRPKPDLGGFRKVVELSDVQPNEILFVGDRVRTDIIPAKTVGMQTALVWREEKTSEADYTFPHVADVLNIFK